MTWKKRPATWKKRPVTWRLRPIHLEKKTYNMKKETYNMGKRPRTWKKRPADTLAFLRYVQVSKGNQCMAKETQPTKKEACSHSKRGLCT
jgi:hypothetical protein